MSFAALCLHLVHIQVDDPQEEISSINRSPGSPEDRPIFFLLLHHTVGYRAQGSGQFVIDPVKFFGEVC
jgi:hypothetical protein